MSQPINTIEDIIDGFINGDKLALISFTSNDAYYACCYYSSTLEEMILNKDFQISKVLWRGF